MLVTLDLGGNRITHVGAQYLSEVLKTNQVREECLLRSDRLFTILLFIDTDLAESQIEETWRRRDSVYQRNIKDQSSKDIFALLWYSVYCSQTLTELIVASNEIGHEGVRHLSDTLTIGQVRRNSRFVEQCRVANLLVARRL